jgi:transposase
MVSPASTARGFTVFRVETTPALGHNMFGAERAEKKVVIGDGAEWIWNIADDHFPGAIQIVDVFHARQRLWDVARKVYPDRDAERKRWMDFHQDELLDEGKIPQRLQSTSDRSSFFSLP